MRRIVDQWEADPAGSLSSGRMGGGYIDSDNDSDSESDHSPATRCHSLICRPARAVARSGRYDDVDPVEGDKRNGGDPGPHRQRPGDRRQLSIRDRPGNRQRSTGYKHQPRQRSQRVGCESSRQLTVEKRGGRSRRAAGRARETSQPAKNAWPKGGGESQPQGAQGDGRNGRRQPQKRQLPVLVRGFAKPH